MSLRASITRLLATNAALLLVGLAVIPLLTRVVSPADWGRYQLLVTLTVVAASILFLKLDAAYVAAKRGRARPGIAAAVLPLSLVTLLVLVLVVGGLVLWREEYGAWTFLAVPGALGLALYQMTQAMQSAEEEFRAYSRTKMLVQLGQNACLLTVAFLAPEAAFLFLAWCLPLLPLSLRYWRRHWRTQGWRRALVVARRSRDFVIYGSASLLVNQLRLVLPLVVMFSLAEPHQYGLLMMAIRLLDLPVSVVSTALQHVFIPRFSAVWAVDAAQVFGLYRRLLALVLVLGAAGAGVLALLPDAFYVALLGGEWAGLRRFLLLVLGWKVLEFMAVPLAPLLNLMGRQRWLFLTGMLALLAMAPVPLFRDFHAAVVYMAVVSGLFYVAIIAATSAGMLARRRQARSPR